MTSSIKKFTLALTAAILLPISGDAKPRRPKAVTAKCASYDQQTQFTKEPTSVDKLTTLWYTRPAINWNQALPLGNGRVGAMAFGGVDKDLIQFNHTNLWLTPGIDEKWFTMDKYPDRRETIEKIRKLIFEGKTYQAHELVKKDIFIYNKNRFQAMGSYQPFALLDFDYQFKSKDVSGYIRTLDMETGIASSQFTRDNTTYKREVFVAKGQDLILLKVTADGEGTINTDIKLDRPVHYPHQTPKTGKLDQNSIFIEGTANGSKVSKHSTSYTAVARAFNKEGSVTAKDGLITVKGAKELVVVLSCATNFNKELPFSPLKLDLKKECLDIISGLNSNKYPALRKLAVDDHSELFNRVSINIGNKAINDRPTDLRVKYDDRNPKLKEADKITPVYDHILETQLFQMGRYLMITSSREGNIAPALRGLWNSNLIPTWAADYHHNINTQMSYWPAEVVNLSECHRPYFELLNRQLPDGQKTASEMFGCRGTLTTVLHGIHQLALPSMPPRAFWVMGGAWAATHIMEHYRFGNDLEYLRNTGYPLLKEHVLFCLDFAVKHPETGKIVLGPNVSAENTFAMNADEAKKKQWSHEDMGCAMDQQLAWQLYKDFLDASKLLGIDDEITAEVRKALPQLAGTEIASNGTVMEWSREYVEAEPFHRHLSHLFAFYPGAQFNIDKDPELAAAALKTIANRSSGPNGAGKIGWSIPWVAALYARFRESEKALEFLKYYHSSRVISNNLMSNQSAAIEQCYGHTAAIAEMLVQSHDGTIQLLPALPAEWKDGEVSGLVARNGFEVSIKWKDGQLTEASILSKKGKSCKIRYKGSSLSPSFKLNQNIKFTSKGNKLSLK